MTRAVALYRENMPAPARRMLPPVQSGAGGVTVMWTASRFHGAVRGMIAPSGASIAAIVSRALLVDPELDEDFREDGAVTINGKEVPRQFWSGVRVRQRPGARVVVVLHPGLGKGGGNVLTTVIQIAAIVAAFVVAGPIGAAAFGSTLATVLALGITVGASLAANALSRPPTLPQLPSPAANNALPGGQSLGKAGISGNALAPGAPVPRMTGARRYAPPFACTPYAYIDGDDEVIEALYAYAGPTTRSERQFGGVAIEDMPDLEIESSDGRPGDPPLTLINRVTATESVNINLSRHKVSADDGTVLENQVQPERSLPIFHPVAGQHDSDEIVILLECPAGMMDLNNPTAPMAAPVRIQFKLAGDPVWINGPEIHFASSNGQRFRKQIKLVREAPPVFVSKAPTTDAPTLAYKIVPGQTITPPRPGWEADAYFSAGSGGDLMAASTFNTHKVRGVSLEKDSAILHLDPAVFPQGRYQVNLSFGAAYKVSAFSSAGYAIGGTVYDLFGFYLTGGVYKTPATRGSLRDELLITRCSSIQHRSPLPYPEGIAFTAIRARNRQLGEYSELAAGLVPDWNGAEWAGLVETRNPAPHYRDRLTHIFPAELIGDDAILDWREFNIDEGHETCAVLRDGSFMDGLNLLAGAGRASPRQSAVFDVLVDRDTSAEAPVQVFSRRNVRDFGIRAPMVEQTGGLYVRFADRALDYKDNFITVANPYASDPSLPFEEITNETHDTEDAVRERALFDIRQHEYRANEYPFEAPVTAMRTQRGDVVAIEHFILSPFTGGARVKDILMSGDDVTGLVLDGSIPTPTDLAFSNIAAAWSNYDLAFAAARLGVAIRLADGTELKAEIVPAGGDSRQIVFVTPFVLPAGLAEGCHVVSGPLGEEYRRMKAKTIVHQGGQRYAVIAVDEANEIHGS